MSCEDRVQCLGQAVLSSLIGACALFWALVYAVVLWQVITMPDPPPRPPVMMEPDGKLIFPEGERRIR